MRLRIATMNLWGLPEPFSVKRRLRLHKAVKIIQEHRLDIIGLQEVWLKQDIAYLRKQFSHYSVGSCDNLLFNSSGLALLSRFQIKNLSLTPFKGSWFNFEFPSRKGFLTADVNIESRTFRLVNTHLYYSRSKKQKMAQEKQARQLSEALKNDPTLLFGDFNMDHKKITLPSSFRCVSEKEQPSIIHANPYSSSRFNKYNSTDRLPDYIFANFPCKQIESFCITDPLVSDHYPIVSEIETA